MKKLLSIILATSIALTALTAKAASFDAKTIAGAALLTVGVASALLSYKLNKDHDKEKSKLHKKLSERYLDLENYNKRSKNNIFRYFGSHAAAFVSFSTTISGAALLAYKHLFGK